MPAAHRFTPPRERVPGAAFSAQPKYGRAESSPHTTLGDTNAVLVTFSGYPDAIDLSAMAFGAIFVLEDFLGRTITEYHVPAGQVAQTSIRAHRVSGRNCVAMSNALVMVTGKWAEPYEAE